MYELSATDLDAVSGGSILGIVVRAIDVFKDNVRAEQTIASIPPLPGPGNEGFADLTAAREP